MGSDEFDFIISLILFWEHINEKLCLI